MRCRPQARAEMTPTVLFRRRHRGALAIVCPAALVLTGGRDRNASAGFANVLFLGLRAARGAELIKVSCASSGCCGKEAVALWV